MKKPCTLTIIAVSLAMNSQFAAANCAWGIPDEVPIQCSETHASCMRAAATSHASGELTCAVVAAIPVVNLGFELCKLMNDRDYVSNKDDCDKAYIECAQEACR